MKTMHLLVCTVIVAVVMGAWPSSSQAIPVFARKYGFNCTMCHSNFPRLNDYGLRYRQNGYQLPGREDDEKTVLESPPPFAMRASASYNYDKFKNSADATDVAQFQLNAFDIMSAGLLARNLGYFMVYPPKIEGSRGVVAQPGTVEMASVVWTNPGTSWLNVRFGRFEPGYVAFSAKRSLSFSPYEIYDFASLSDTSGTGMAFAATRSGIEFAGYGWNGFGYVAGLTNGSEQNNENDSPADMYLRFSKVFEQGEGQTTGQRIGILGYMGKARPAAGGDRQNLVRLGMDASLNLKHCNLALQYLWGEDNQQFWGTTDKFKFSGGFAEFSYLPATDLVGFVRYDWVNLPSSFNEDIRRWTLGGRYYLADNVATHLEYSRRTQKAATPGDPKATENFITAGLDFAY